MRVVGPCSGSRPSVPDEPPNGRPVRVFAVTSGKGGVGKTAITVNLAYATASLGRSVTIFDADLGLANVDLMLKLRPTFTLSDVINGSCGMEEIIINGPRGIKVIPGASGHRSLINLSTAQHSGLIDACNILADETEVLLIDTATGISEGVLQLCAASQEIIIVVCNEPTSINDAHAMMRVLRDNFRIKRFHVLANMARRENEGRLLLHKLLHVTPQPLDVVLQLLGTVPYDDRFSALVRQGRILMEAYPGCPAALALIDIARRIDDSPVQQNPTGRLEFFLERLIAAAKGGSTGPA